MLSLFTLGLFIGLGIAVGAHVVTIVFGLITPKTESRHRESINMLNRRNELLEEQNVILAEIEASLRGETSNQEGEK